MNSGESKEHLPEAQSTKLLSVWSMTLRKDAPDILLMELDPEAFRTFSKSCSVHPVLPFMMSASASMVDTAAPSVI